MGPNKACLFFLAKFEDILFIWLTTQDLPARVAVTGRVTTSHLIWVRELEFPAVACPADEGLAGLVGQQLQKKLPQLDGAAACRADGREGACLEGTTVVGVDTARGELCASYTRCFKGHFPDGNTLTLSNLSTVNTMQEFKKLWGGAVLCRCTACDA